jgi:hypothetical protein
MGGGGGHRDRRSGGGSGGGSDDSKDDGPTPVPTPEEGDDEEDSDSSDEHEEDSEETSDGGVGGGAPATVPTGESKDTDSDPDDESDPDDVGNDDPEDEDSDDKCLISEIATLHSPDPDVLTQTSEGDICSVKIRDGAVCIVDSKDRTIGAIAEPWIDELKQCLQLGYQYRAHIREIDGGHCEVWVTNKCLINQTVELESVNTDILAELNPELELSVVASGEGVIAVTANETTVGTISQPWSDLLLECLESNYIYEAIIEDVSADSCTVKLQNDGREE